jgi:Zn-dependent membrane protease YugP
MPCRIAEFCSAHYNVLIMFYILAALLFLGLLFLPRMWVRNAIASHAGERPDFPGTGGELARHLLDDAGLEHVTVEALPVEGGDHYDPVAKAVRLSPSSHNGKSVSAVAIAAHEVGHALQDGEGYKPLALRTRMAGAAQKIQAIGSVLLIGAPIVMIITRKPSILLLELGAGLAIMATGIVVHLITLPVEFDASFKRALPILKNGQYLHPDDLPGARKVLRAAAFTYVAAAMVSLLDIMRWLRILRF